MKGNNWKLLSGLILVISYSLAKPTQRALDDPGNRAERSLTWAKLIQQRKNDHDIVLSATSLLSKEGSLPANRISRRKETTYNPPVKVPSPLHRRKTESLTDPQNIPRLYSQNGYKSSQNGYKSNQNGYKSSQNGYKSNQNGYKSQTPQSDSKLPDDKLQKRALDFIYHKFVEPKLHKHVDPRPSLIEELISTFESHVQKDLTAWGKSAAFQREVSETVSQVSHQHAPLEEDPDLAATEISSISQVEPGSDEDTFIVTDENGATQVITVNEIIDSLALMDEDEILDLLLEDPSGLPIERSDRLISRRSDVFEPSEPIVNDRRPSFKPSRPPSRPGPVSYGLATNDKYSENQNRRSILKDERKSDQIDEDDVLLIQDEDGDVRLVTVNDVLTKYSPGKGSSSFTSKPGDGQTTNQQNPAFLTLSGLLNSQGLTGGEEEDYIKSTTRRPPNQSPSHHQHQIPDVSTHLKAVPKSDPNMDIIRQSLAQIRKNNPLLAPIGQSNSQNAPNAPPVKVLNTLNPGNQFTPYRNTISISPSYSQPENQNSGIKNTLSNFFSRLLGRKVTNVDISQQTQKEKDEFVQIIMPPNPDSPTMEQITIPLPKPIHHSPRYFEKKSSRVEKTRISMPSISSIFRRSAPKKDQNPEQDSVHLSTSTTELILKAAKVPENVRKKIMEQMSDKPNFKFPMEAKHTEPIERIDRVFNINDDHKKKKKQRPRPTSYTYFLPAPTYVESNRPPPPKPAYTPTFFAGHHTEPLYQEQPYYVPPPSAYEIKETKPKDKNKDKKKDDELFQTKGPPLFDISFLSDVNNISQMGKDDDQSFSFPRIGDASKFIEVRPNRYNG